MRSSFFSATVSTRSTNFLALLARSSSRAARSASASWGWAGSGVGGLGSAAVNARREARGKKRQVARSGRETRLASRVSHLDERRRFSDHVAPVIGAARIRADQQLARERRERVLDDVSAKARDFIRRAVLTCAFVEVRDARRAERGRARIEARLSAACDRKEAYLLERVQPRSPATTTEATNVRTRTTTARGGRRADASPVAPFGVECDARRLSLSVPTSPVA